jgi:23S rRNA (uracil1939-C5)-methyltransferase
MAPEPASELPPIRVEQVVYPGKSLAHHRGKILFTDEGLPGELIAVQTVRERAGYIEARTVRVLEASARRREPRCAHYRACAPYQVMDYAFQLELKKSQVEDILGRQFGVDPGPVTVKPSPETWGYRNRARFHCARAQGRLSLAYHRPGSLRSWIPVRDCHLISDRMNGLLAAALDMLNEARATDVNEIEVRETASGRESLLILSGRKLGTTSLPPGFGPKLAKRFPLSGLIGLSQTPKGASETILYGRGYLENEAGGLVYRCGARSFFQVNRFLLDAALNEVRTVGLGARPGRAADLYCGVGTFGLALAAAAGEVRGVESDPANAGDLAHNVQSNGLRNFAVSRGTAEAWIDRILAEKPDLVMVDPPRKGLGPRITGPILESPPPLILYLSCDPATLGRDLKILMARYRLRSLTLYDFFPHTPHIETLSILDRV